MYVCDDNHDEIVHDNLKYDCPICKLLEDKETEISDLEANVSSLESDVKQLEEDVDKLEQRILEDA